MRLFIMDREKLYRLIKESNASIITDSRAVSNGDIFFALKGDNFDGNAYAAEAIENGAGLAVIDDPQYSGDNTILVDNALLALQDLARIHRKNLNIPVIAITGSNGKTTTRELTTLVLSDKFRVHSTRGNLNNHIGLPLTLLAADDTCEMIVIEMGANHIGEINTLCTIADPDFGLITNIGKAHLEGFGSLEGVIQAKSELYRYIDNKKGTLIYNDSNSLLKELIAPLRCNVIPYSRPGRDLIVEEVPSKGNIIFKLNYDTYSGQIETKFFGIHNLENIKAAISIGLVFGVDISHIVNIIQDYIPVNNRSQLEDTGKNLLLCDAYNANPVSMMNALQAFTSSNEKRSRTIILGDMLELGSYSSEEHSKLVEYLSSISNISVYLVGDEFCKAAHGSSLKCFLSTELLIKHLESNPIRDNFILLKGSRAIALEKVFPLL